MKRLLVSLTLFFPSLVLVLLSLWPEADPTASLPLFHFYIVTFTTFAAAVISILLSSTLGSVAQPRHVLAAVAFAVIASIFFLHGLATRGALIDYSHPAVRWSAWLTLFGGGLIFALAGLAGPADPPKWLSLRRVIYAAAMGVIVYLGLATLAPQWLTLLDDYTAAWQMVIVLLSLGLWLFAAFCLWQTWRITRNRVDGTLALVAFWLAHAVISMHQFPVWRLSWWLYHFLLCGGFLITMYILVSEYEQTRRFRLLHYYLGISLIATALLALVASYLFAEFSYRTLVAETKSSTASLVNGLTHLAAAAISDDAGTAARQAGYAAYLPEQALGTVTLYGADGQLFYPANSDGSSDPSLIDPLKFERALAGETIIDVRSPEDGSGYNALGAVYTVETYAPLPAAPLTSEAARPVGVLVALRAAPELGQTVLQARATGLIISALTMGLLFILLLAVIGRADRIIVARTEELLQAYASLRQAENMRDDLNHMIVHDLRNPLNVISATIELIDRTSGETRLKTLDRFWESIYHATQRLTGLIDDILAVSKIEAGQLAPRFVTTSLAELLNEQLISFKPLAVVENKQLNLDCPSDLTAELDPALMGRVIENLVGNAFKYTQGEGMIHISAQVENGCVRLSVRDDGDGIPDEYKQHIFEKFIQAPNTNGQAVRKGIGLGLAFCNLVVQAHGGRIWVTDAPGGGSEFVMLLPRNH
jgi:signal transduction histidine kinase